MASMLKRPCIIRERFINKIRELGYTYRDKKKRVELWRRPTPMHAIPVPLPNLLSDEFVRSALKQSGLTMAEIENFISTASSSALKK